MRYIWLWFILAGLLWPAGSSAGLAASGATARRDPATITDWYIHDFQADFTVNSDSSLRATYAITADAGELPDKHGIFVVVPTRAYLDRNKVALQPVELVAITNEDGAALLYRTQRSRLITTWQIGDPNRTVTGLNAYKIDFTTRNAILFTDDTAEFYWDILGTD